MSLVVTTGAYLDSVKSRPKGFEPLFIAFASNFKDVPPVNRKKIDSTL
jgi:hypothetical protein